MEYKIDLQPIIGSDGIQTSAPNLQVGAVRQQFDSPALQQSLGQVRAYLEKRREQKQKTAIEQGQLAQEAGNAWGVRSAIEDPEDLVGFDIGRNYQVGIQGIHQSLEAFSKQYATALRSGASNEERQQLYQDSINTIGNGITELQLPDAYKQQLRKQALEQLDLFVKVRSQADKQYAQEQYDKTRAQAGYSLRTSLIGASSIQDPKAAATALQATYESMYTAAHAAGHIEDARKRASESTRDAIIGVLQNFDVTDPTQVAARNMLLKVGEETLGKYLEADDFNQVLGQFSKATTAIRDYEGLQVNLQIAELEQRIISGEVMPRDYYDGIIRQQYELLKQGKLNVSDFKGFINKVTDIYGKQQNMVAQAARDAAAAEKDGTNVVQELTGMSLAEAQARGKESQWGKAWKQQAMLMAQGNPTQAGFVLLGVANLNRSPELAREAAQMASREFVYFLENTDPQQYANSSNNKQAHEGFQQWFQLYKQADPAVRDAYLQGLGAETAALVTEVLRQNPNASLAEAIQFKQQWKKYDGNTRRQMVAKTIDGDWKEAMPIQWNLGISGVFDLYRDDYEKHAQGFNIGIAKQIMQSLATDAVLQGHVITSPEAAVAYMQSRGNILLTGNQYLVFNDANRARLRQAMQLQNDSSLATEVMQKYLEKVAKKFDTEASAVTVDGTWDDPNRLRFVVFAKDGTSKVVFENWSDIKATASAITAKRPKVASAGQSSKATNVFASWYSAADAVTKAVPKAPQTVAKPAVKPAKPIVKAPVVPAPTKPTTKEPPAGSRSGRIAILETEIRNEKAALAAAKQKGNTAEIADRAANLRAIERELKQMR